MLYFLKTRPKGNNPSKQARSEAGCSASLAEYYRGKCQASADVCGWLVLKSNDKYDDFMQLVKGIPSEFLTTVGAMFFFQDTHVQADGFIYISSNGITLF